MTEGEKDAAGPGTETDGEAGEGRRWTDPEHAARGLPTGIVVELADGREWTLAYGGAARKLREYRDRIFDDVTIHQKVKGADIRIAAYFLLNANYDLEDDEALELINGAPADELAEAVVSALLWQESPSRTYTDWIESALWANNIDPDRVPPGILTFVLDQLVETGRAIPLKDFSDAAMARRKRAAFFSLVPRKDD